MSKSGEIGRGSNGSARARARIGHEWDYAELTCVYFAAVVHAGHACTQRLRLRRMGAVSDGGAVGVVFMEGRVRGVEISVTVCDADCHEQLGCCV